MGKYKFVLLDICLPDYFQGYSGVVLAVPVDGDTTKEGITSMIWHEYNSCDWDKLPDLSDSEIEKMCEEFVLTERPFNGIIAKATEDTIDSVYMYFTVVKDDETNNE